MSMFDYHEMSYIRMLIEQCEDRSVANGDTASAALTQTILAKMPAVRDTGPFAIVPTSRLALAEQVATAFTQFKQQRDALKASDEAAYWIWLGSAPTEFIKSVLAVFDALESYDRSAVQEGEGTT